MTVEHFAALPDSELIESCLQGHFQAWEVLLARYQRLVYSIPLRYGLTEHDANDVFQNVSLLLVENLAKLRDRERLGAWLVITTRRESWRLLRQHQPDSLDSETVSSEKSVPGALRSEDDFVALERQALVRSAVELLDPRCQRLLEMLFYTDPRPSYAEIARALSLPDGSIGPGRARCLEKLMKILEGIGLSET
jgi:RNA polymerase sigma factor (sigma-70 family)